MPHQLQTGSGGELYATKNPFRPNASPSMELPDILHLVRICGLDAESSEFEEKLHRYGNEETRAIVRRHLEDIR